jgi:hypothetical protein
MKQNRTSNTGGVVLIGTELQKSQPPLVTPRKRYDIGRQSGAGGLEHAT